MAPLFIKNRQIDLIVEIGRILNHLPLVLICTNLILQFGVNIFINYLVNPTDYIKKLIFFVKINSFHVS